MFAKLAHLMYRRRRQVILAWLVILIVAGSQAMQVGKVLGPGNYAQKGSDSEKAAALLDSRFRQNDLKVTLVVMHATHGTVSAPSFRHAVEATVARIRANGALRLDYLDDPLVTGNRQLISNDGRSIALLLSSKLDEPKIEAQIDHLRSLVRTPGVATYVTGTAASNHDYAVATEKDLARGDSITIPILILILLVVFGTLVAAGLPLLLAICSIAVSLALVYVIAHFLDTSIYVTEVITFLGLGIGIDYSLFIVYRFREELQARHDVETAVVRTMATTGRAVFFSGLTVAIGLSSLILTNVSFMVSMGLGGMLVPLTSLLVAMTLLPAMLGVLGHRINRLRVVPRRLVGTGEGRVWRRLATIIMRRPAVAGGVVFALLLGLTLPVTQLNFAFGSLKNAPRHLESVEGALSMQHSFPTTPNPTQVVIEHRGPGTLLDPREIAGMRELERSIRHDPEALKVVGLPDVVPGDGVTGAARHSQAVGRFVTPDGRSALISVVARHDVGTKGAEDLVRHIRAMASRASAGALRGNEIHVGGAQASYTDFNDALYDHFPLIVAIVLALSYLFLFYAFRSAFLPLKAVLLNLLSVGAAYGMLQLVFQRGIGASVLGFTPESGVAGWVPIMMFAFLFGLSMDYEVFLLSRIREAWLDSGHNGEAVTSGLQKTGRLITSAAAIMIVAFSGFLIGGVLTLKEFGFGLLASIALDATLIRLVLVPSIMQLVGNANWWVPGFLRGFAARAGSFETLDDSAEELELAS